MFFARIHRLPIRWVILGATLTALAFSLAIWSLGAIWLGQSFLWYSQEWRMIAQLRMVWPENERGQGLLAGKHFPAESAGRIRALSVAGNYARMFGPDLRLLAEPAGTIPVPPPRPEQLEEVLGNDDAEGHRHIAYALDSSERDWMVVLIPIRQDGHDVGVLQFCVPRREPREVTRMMVGYLGAAAAAAALVCAVSALALAHWLGEPINRLHRTTLLLRQGDLKARTGMAGIPSANELDQVSAAFDQMASYVEQTLVGQRRFVADASHELKTPLTAISGMAEMLKLTQDPEKQSKAVRIIVHESERMSRLVGDLLTLSKAEQAPTEPGLGKIDLGKMLRENVEVVGASHPERRLQARVEEGLYLMGNPDELLRVMRNLLENAVQHTPESALIQASCQRKGKTIVLEVSDTGPGIDPKDLPYLFDRFYRPDSSRARKTGGSGLGLAIVKSIAHRHGGQVEVASEVGKGTTFRIVFGGDS